MYTSNLFSLQTKMVTYNLTGNFILGSNIVSYPVTTQSFYLAALLFILYTHKHLQSLAQLGTSYHRVFLSNEKKDQLDSYGIKDKVPLFKLLHVENTDSWGKKKK